MKRKPQTLACVLLSIFYLFHLLRFPTTSKEPTIRRDSCRSKRRRYQHIHTSNINNNTGIILFYHVAKTGGTTIRRNFSSVKHVHYILVKQAELPVRQIEAVLTGKQRHKLLFVEFHGVSPGIPKLGGYIQEWRGRAKQQGIPFFAFTLLRQPVDLIVSAFGMRHRRDDSLVLDQDELVNTALPNRQCRVLYHGQGKRDVSVVSAQECHQVAEHLCNDWDWVGTTEHLSTSTFPLVHQLVHHTTWPPGQEVVSANVAARPVEISAKTRGRLTKLSRLDQTLYNAFRED